MRTPDFVLATLDEAAPALARLRAALKGGGVCEDQEADSSLAVSEVRAAPLNAASNVPLVQDAKGLLLAVKVTPATEVPSVSVADFVRQHPGALLCEVAEAALLSVGEAEVQLRALARLRQVQAAAGEDGIVRWWPVEEAP